MIFTRRGNILAGASIALLMLASCGSSGSDATPKTRNTVAVQITTTTANDSSGSTTAASSDPTTTSGSVENPPAEFGTTIPVPKGSTFKKDGFAIGNDGPRKAEFEFSGGDTASALNDYKSTLEADGYTISREQPGRGYVAKKGDMELQVVTKSDLYDDGVVILSIIYTTESP